MCQDSTSKFELSREEKDAVEAEFDVEFEVCESHEEGGWAEVPVEGVEREKRCLDCGRTLEVVMGASYWEWGVSEVA